MNIPYDLTADLPPLRDDEPASLRQDIVDELADHLECALRRELVRGATSGPCETASEDSSFRTDPRTDSSFRTAQQTVLARFGDPAALARRLWLDAMKERLMVQKITILLASVATAAVVVLSVLMWQSLQRSHEAQAALLQQQQQFSASILETFKALRTAPAAPASVDGWSPLTVKLVSETGEPVQGEVRVYGNMLGSTKSEGDFDVNLSRTTGPDGVVECGMIPYGNYEMRITVSAAQETHRTQIMVAPGQPTERTVVCPTTPPPPVSMRFKIDPPAGFEREKLIYSIVLTEFREIGSAKWGRAEGQDYVTFLVDAEENVLGSLGESVTVEQELGSEWPRTQIAVYALDDSKVPEFRAYRYRIQGVTVFVRVDNVEGVPPDFSQITVVAGSDGVGVSAETAEFQPRSGDNIWSIEIPSVAWQWIVYGLRLSPLTQHVALPAGMQIIDADITARSLMNLPWYRDRIINPDQFHRHDRTRELPPTDRVDILIRQAIASDPVTGRSRHSEETLIRSVELIRTPDPRRQFGRGGFTGNRSDATVSVSLLVTDAQVEAIRIAEQKGVLSVRPTDEELPIPELDEALFEQLQELPDKES